MSTVIFSAIDKCITLPFYYRALLFIGLC